MSGKQSAQKDSFFSFNNLKSLATLLIIIFAVRWSVVAPYHVPTSSMEPTIKVGDRVIANHLAYQLRVPFTSWILLRWSSPGAGDIVVFDSVTDPGINLVKRVVAVAGDKVEMKNDQLFVNDQPVASRPAEDQDVMLSDVEDRYEKRLVMESRGDKEHYVMWNEHPMMEMRNYCGICYQPMTIPEGSIFVMGDNRDNSKDSRFFGSVKVDSVYGRASRVLWSLHFTDARGQSGWTPRFRFYRFGRALL